MLEVVVRAALCSLLLALVIQLSLWGLRVRHAHLQLSAWTAVLIASLAMPALQCTVPTALPAPLLSFSLAEVVDPATPAQRSALPQVSDPAAAVTRASEAQRALAWLQSLGTLAWREWLAKAYAWREWLAKAYVFVACALLLRLLLGLALSWRLLRTAQPVQADWVAGRKISASTRISSPVTIGDNVLLPGEYANWDAPTREAVLAHEGAHVARGDFYIQILSQLNRAIFWFSPLSWWLHARLSALAELASDDAAIEALGDRPGYASILLHVARVAGTLPTGVAMARPVTVARRIERILASEIAPGRVSWLRQILIAAMVAPPAMLAAVLFGGATPREAVDELQAPFTRITIDPKLLDAYVGFYRNATTGSVMVVTREDDHLLSRRIGQNPVPEFPYTDHDFFLTAAPKQNHFVTDASGAVVGVVHHQAGRDEKLQRISAEAAQRDLKREADERAPHTEISIDSHLLDSYVGTYQLKPHLAFSITRQGDHLLARVTGQQTFEIHPYTERDFFYTIVAAQISFVPGHDGTASALVLHQGGKDQTAPRVDPSVAQELDRKRAEESTAHTPITVAPRLLDRYVGRYVNDDVEITATRENDQLYVQVTGYLRYRVFPYTDHEFFATFKPIQISFATDSTGKAIQLVRHQDGREEILKRQD
jgi:beta-lactamase regulating signal transducer with metallopeptidase domain